LRVYVVDASVAVRFLLVEDLSEKAAKVLEDFLAGAVDLVAPELIVYEVGNALWRAVRMGFIGEEDAKQKFLKFLRLRISGVRLGEGDLVEVLRWAAENDATYYDAAYVVASRVARAALLTADDLLYERARREVEVVHLREYPP